MVNGAYVSDGTIISAWIDGNKYAEVGTFTFEPKSVYTIEVPANNPDTLEKDGGMVRDCFNGKAPLRNDIPISFIVTQY